MASASGVEQDGKVNLIENASPSTTIRIGPPGRGTKRLKIKTEGTKSKADNSSEAAGTKRSTKSPAKTARGKSKSNSVARKDRHRAKRVEWTSAAYKKPLQFLQYRHAGYKALPEGTLRVQYARTAGKRLLELFSFDTHDDQQIVNAVVNWFQNHRDQDFPGVELLSDDEVDLSDGGLDSDVDENVDQLEHDDAANDDADANGDEDANMDSGRRDVQSHRQRKVERHRYVDKDGVTTREAQQQSDVQDDSVPHNVIAENSDDVRRNDMQRSVNLQSDGDVCKDGTLPMEDDRGSVVERNEVNASVNDDFNDTQDQSAMHAGDPTEVDSRCFSQQPKLSRIVRNALVNIPGIKSNNTGMTIMHVKYAYRDQLGNIHFDELSVGSSVNDASYEVFEGGTGREERSRWERFVQMELPNYPRKRDERLEYDNGGRPILPEWKDDWTRTSSAAVLLAYLKEMWQYAYNGYAPSELDMQLLKSAPQTLLPRSWCSKNIEDPTQMQIVDLVELHTNIVRAQFTDDAFMFTPNRQDDNIKHQGRHRLPEDPRQGGSHRDDVSRDPSVEHGTQGNNAARRGHSGDVVSEDVGPHHRLSQDNYSYGMSRSHTQHHSGFVYDNPARHGHANHGQHWGYHTQDGRGPSQRGPERDAYNASQWTPFPGRGYSDDARHENTYTGNNYGWDDQVGNSYQHDDQAQRRYERESERFGRNHVYQDSRQRDSYNREMSYYGGPEGVTSSSEALQDRSTTTSNVYTDERRYGSSFMGMAINETGDGAHVPQPEEEYNVNNVNATREPTDAGSQTHNTTTLFSSESTTSSTQKPSPDNAAVISRGIPQVTNAIDTDESVTKRKNAEDDEDQHSAKRQRLRLSSVSRTDTPQPSVHDAQQRVEVRDEPFIESSVTSRVVSPKSSDAKRVDGTGVDDGAVANTDKI